MREIVVYTGRTTPKGVGVDYAARLCAQFEASLSGLYIHQSPVELMPPFGVPALLTEMIEAAQQAEAAAIAAGGTFPAEMRALGVAHASWQVAEGHAPSVLAHVADWADLLVFERDAGTAWSSPHELGVLVLHAGMPVILVPPSASDARLERIAIGWNASPKRCGRSTPRCRCSGAPRRSSSSRTPVAPRRLRRAGNPDSTSSPTCVGTGSRRSTPSSMQAKARQAAPCSKRRVARSAICS